MTSRISLTLIILAFSLYLFSEPAITYDYHVTQNSISPISTALGGTNASFYSDPLSVYNNPSLLAESTSSLLIAGFRHYSPSSNISDMYGNPLNLLKDNQLSYLGLIMDKGAICYQPLSSIENDKKYTIADVSYREYTDFYLNSFQITTSAKEKDFAFGINLKYLTGRLVHLRETEVDSVWIREEFIDDRANGFSTDIGFHLKKTNVVYGLSFHDVFSKIYWKKGSDRILKRRYTLGLHWENEETAFLLSMSGRLKMKKNPTFHFGYSKYVIAGDPNVTDISLLLRVGAYSEKFESQKNIFYSIGSGFYYGAFRFDCSITNNDWKIENNRYLISISFGI